MDLIDYNGESTDIETKLWTHSAFKRFFNDCHWKTHRVGTTIPWTIKETVLLKRMMEEFSKNDLADMITYWHTTHKSSVAIRFDNFYANRIEIYYKMKEATGEYSWE